MRRLWGKQEKNGTGERGFHVGEVESRRTRTETCLLDLMAWEGL